MPLSTKRFILSDSSLNRHGFRVLTSGVNLEQFMKNPIMLWMHGRAWGRKDEVLPLGHWQDIKVEGDEISAIPFFSDDDDFAMSIYKKVEEGTIRMASAGLDPLETSEMPDDMLPGQRWASVTKSMMLEASIVDMGSNDNACALYKDGALIKLSDGDLSHVLPLLKFKNSNMNPQLLALAIMLGLGKDATEIQLAEKMTATHAELLKLQKERTDLVTAKTDLETKLAALELATANQKVDDFLALAVKDGKITEAQVPDFKELATLNFDSVKSTIDKMPAHISAQARMAANASGAEANPLLKLSFDEAHQSGKLSEIKEKHPEHYKAIFKSKFNKEPK